MLIKNSLGSSDQRRTDGFPFQRARRIDLSLSASQHQRLLVLATCCDLFLHRHQASANGIRPPDQQIVNDSIINTCQSTQIQGRVNHLLVHYARDVAKLEAQQEVRLLRLRF